MIPLFSPALSNPAASPINSNFQVYSEHDIFSSYTVPHPSPSHHHLVSGLLQYLEWLLCFCFCFPLVSSHTNFRMILLKCKSDYIILGVKNLHCPPIRFKIVSSLLTMTYKNLCDLILAYSPTVISCFFIIFQPHWLSISQTLQAPCHLKVFSLAVTSAWNILLLGLHIVYSISFRFLFKCLLGGIFLVCPTKNYFSMYNYTLSLYTN